MVVGARREDAGFLEAGFADETQVLPLGPHPPGDLRVPVPSREYLADRLPVTGAVEEELALADHAVGTAQAVEQVVQPDDLGHPKGGAGLLPVAKRRVGDENLLGRGQGHVQAVEKDFGGIAVGELLAHQVRSADLHQINGLPRVGERPPVLHSGPPERTLQT